MDWRKKFPWRRLLALLLVALALTFASTFVQGETMYVKVNSSSPDAVIQSSTDEWDAELVGKLIQNQPVEMLDKTDGEYVMIRATVEGKEVEGWVKKIILQKKPLENQPRVSESGAVDTASFAGNGYNEAVESDMKKNSDEMQKALAQVDQFEAGRNRVFGGDPKEPDPAAQRTQVKKFAKDGKLIQ